MVWVPTTQCISPIITTINKKTKNTTNTINRLFNPNHHKPELQPHKTTKSKRRKLPHRMTALRALSTITAGIGCLCGVALEEYQRKRFKVNAQVLNIPKHHSSEMYRLVHYGFPQRDIIIPCQDFEISFDKRNRTPNWVVERLSYDKLKIEPGPEKFSTQPDLSGIVPRMFQATICDFYVLSPGTWYWRVQMAAEQNHLHDAKSHNDSLRQTNIFALTRYVKYSWHDLEAYLRYLTHCYKNIYVITGIVYEPRNEYIIAYEVLGLQSLAVPSALYKIVFAVKEGGGVDMGCYIMENGTVCSEWGVPLSEFRIELPKLEKKVGFKLFENPKAYLYFSSLPDIPDFRDKFDEYMCKVGLEHTKAPRWGI